VTPPDPDYSDAMSAHERETDLGDRMKPVLHARGSLTGGLDGRAAGAPWAPPIEIRPRENRLLSLHHVPRFSLQGGRLWRSSTGNRLSPSVFAVSVGEFMGWAAADERHRNWAPDYMLVPPPAKKRAMVVCIEAGLGGNAVFAGINADESSVHPGPRRWIGARPFGATARASTAGGGKVVIRIVSGRAR